MFPTKLVPPSDHFPPSQPQHPMRPQSQCAKFGSRGAGLIVSGVHKVDHYRSLYPLLLHSHRSCSRGDQHVHTNSLLTCSPPLSKGRFWYGAEGVTTQNNAGGSLSAIVVVVVPAIHTTGWGRISPRIHARTAATLFLLISSFDLEMWMRAGENWFLNLVKCVVVPAAKYESKRGNDLFWNVLF